VEILSPGGQCCGYRERARRRWGSHRHRHPTRLGLSSLPIDRSHSDALADKGGGHLAWSFLIIGAGSGCNRSMIMMSDICTTTPRARQRVRVELGGCPGALRRQVVPRELRVDRKLFGFNIYLATRVCKERSHAVNFTVCLLDRASATVLIGNDDSGSEGNSCSSW